MVLAVLACLLSIGLLFQSALFVIWVLVLAAPAWVVYLKLYEERELEIRFGPSYRAYRARTSFLWPRRPRAPTIRGSQTLRDQDSWKESLTAEDAGVRRGKPFELAPRRPDAET